MRRDFLETLKPESNQTVKNADEFYLQSFRFQFCLSMPFMVSSFAVLFFGCFLYLPINIVTSFCQQCRDLLKTDIFCRQRPSARPAGRKWKQTVVTSFENCNFDVNHRDDHLWTALQLIFICFGFTFVVRALYIALLLLTKSQTFSLPTQFKRLKNIALLLSN